jgi:hypothetical protein
MRERREDTRGGNPSSSAITYYSLDGKSIKVPQSRGNSPTFKYDNAGISYYRTADPNPPAPAPVPEQVLAPPAPTPTPTYYAPSAPPAPTVASASSVNEVRESDKKRKGFQSTLLSKGQNPKRTRSRSKQQESKMRQGKPSYGETTKKTLLGSAS